MTSESYEKRTWWTTHRLTERLADDSFLDAAINAAFLIAASDGTQSEEEYDALLDRLEILGGVERDKIDEKLTAAAQALEASGTAPRIAYVGELVGDADAAAAVYMLALAIALADNEVSDDERKAADELAVGLGIDPQMFAGALAEIRG